MQEFVESKQFFASINQTQNPDYEFYFEFKDCDYGNEEETSGARSFWRFSSILTWTLVPYWQEEGRCLSVTSVSMRKPLHLRADSTVYSSLFLLPVNLWKGMSGNDTRMDRNLIESFLARLHKFPKGYQH